MKFHSFIIASSLLLSLSAFAKNPKSDDSGLVIKKTFSKNDKVKLIELRDASEWSLEKLSSKVGVGESDNDKYDVCYQGNVDEVAEILKAIVEEGNKNVGKRRERVIFALGLSDVNYKGFPHGYFILETGYKGDKDPSNLLAIKPCSN